MPAIEYSGCSLSTYLQLKDNAIAAHSQVEQVVRDRVVSIDRPFRFDSYLRPQVWGGRLLEEILGRDLPNDGPFGEAWDISALSQHVSHIVEGPFQGESLANLWATRRSDLAGKDSSTTSSSFPLLIKWLNCREYLSLQVHPNDSMAQSVLGQPCGKSEAWIVLHAEPTARIYAGIKPDVGRSEFTASLESGKLVDCLHSFAPKRGDFLSLPAGTVHAAGGGLLMAEVQQSSDSTFRLFDWNRVGLDGRPRPLQIDLALQAINWNQGPVEPIPRAEVIQSTVKLKLEHSLSNSSFNLQSFKVLQSCRVPYVGEFTIWMVIEGQLELSGIDSDFHQIVRLGDTIMVPATAKPLQWEIVFPGDSAKVLCIRLPRPEQGIDAKRQYDISD